MTARSVRGFTLLEVMISLAILAVSLVAISGLNGGAVAMEAYSRRATEATLLLRAKMTDIEDQLHKDGFSDFDDDTAPIQEGEPENLPDTPPLPSIEELHASIEEAALAALRGGACVVLLGGGHDGAYASHSALLRASSGRVGAVVSQARKPR